MLFNKVNSIKKKRFQAQPGVCHNTIGHAPVTDAQTGFIHHRQGFPLHFKQVQFDLDSNHGDGKQSNFGLLFQSNQYLKPGTTIEAEIFSHDRSEKVRGKVVMVRDRGDHFEIGLWLRHLEDASRARIMEQACHIEAYIKEKKFRDGPYILNRDGAAQEWINKNAAAVPGL